MGRGGFYLKAVLMALPNITHVVQELQLNITNSSNYFGTYLQIVARKAGRIDISSTYRILSRSCIGDIFIYI